jgi:tetratricopeptide (TPR) repeat protein
MIAAMVGVLAAFVVAAGIDWMWELSIVGLVAVAALGILVGRATAAPRAGTEPAPAHPAGRAHLRGRGLRVAGVAAALGAIVCAALPMLSQQRLEESRAAAARGDTAAAIEAADDARAVQPWASSPYLQLALLEEQDGNLRQANRYVGEALERDSSDWATWLVAARVQTKAGFIGRGRRSLREAERLNRRSELFDSLPKRAAKPPRNAD